MRILIVKDYIQSRKYLLRFLSQVGDCDVVTDGIEAIEFFMSSLDKKCYYDIICLDVSLPQKSQKTIQTLECEWNVPLVNRAKIILTSDLSDAIFCNSSSKTYSEKFPIKPVDTEKFREVMIQLGLKEDWV